MFKTVFILICIAFVCCSLSNGIKCKKANLEYEDDDKILWSSKRKLVWGDFKDSPNPSFSANVAISCLRISMNYTYLGNGDLNCKIENYFIKSKSWTITNTNQALAHEQLHFNISELYARKIRKSFDSLKVFNDRNIENYNKIYHSNITKRDNYDKLYDSQVYGNKQLQIQWIKKVGAELLKLKKYEYIPEE